MSFNLIYLASFIKKRRGGGGGVGERQKPTVTLPTEKTAKAGSSCMWPTQWNPK